MKKEYTNFIKCFMFLPAIIILFYSPLIIKLLDILWSLKEWIKYKWTINICNSYASINCYFIKRRKRN